MKSPRGRNVREKVSSFWNWFSEHSSELANREIADALIQELERRLFAIQRLDWEIGPGRNAPNLFALSPCGKKQLLDLTRSIVASAPLLPGWEIHPAKLPRDWNLVFNLVVDDGSAEIDGKCWEFIAYKFKDGTYDLVFKPGDTKGLADDYLHWAATIIVDGEIGEETRLELVQDIEVVNAWDEEKARSAQKVRPGLLAEMLRSS